MKKYAWEIGSVERIIIKKNCQSLVREIRKYKDIKL